MHTKAVLFDMNGIIVDDEDLQEASFARVLEHRGLKLSHRDYISCFAGKTDESGLVSFFKSQSKKPEGVDKLCAEKTAAYRELAREGLRPCDGALSLIKQLHEKGIRLAIVTSSTRLEAEMVVGILSISKYIEVIVSADEIRFSKPNPQGYITAVTALGLRAEDCVAVEDSPAGIVAAKEASIKCVAVARAHSLEELEDADFIVRTLDSVKTQL